MHIALVHDYLTQYGGAERVLEQMLKIYPQAPLYTLIYAPKNLPVSFRRKLKNRKIITSGLQRIPGAKNHYKFYLWAMPYYVEQWDFSGYDVVLSDSASYTKGIITPPHCQHICYCHTPLRYVWDQTHQYQESYPYPRLIKKIIPFSLHYLRIWDRQAAQRPEKILCNSNFVKSRIKKYYRRNAQVLPPPVKVKRLNGLQTKKGNFFLIVSRLIPYKKVDLAVRAFNNLKLPLKIIGAGPEMKKIKKIAKDNIDILGEVYGRELEKYYCNCRAFVMPQIEDFGIAPIEAMACGKPLIAYQKGGAIDYVKKGVNGIFFSQQNPESLQKAIEKFQNTQFYPEKIKKSVEKFDEKNFREKIKKVIAKQR